MNQILQTTERDIRALVIDDSVTYRKALTELLDDFAHMECRATAGTISVARAKMEVLSFDLILIDCDLILGDNLAFMREIEQKYGYQSVILLAKPNRIKEKDVVDAMEIGVFDLVVKPSEDSYAQIRNKITETLPPVLKAFSRMLNVKNILLHHSNRAGSESNTSPNNLHPQRKQDQTNPRFISKHDTRRTPPKVVAIGISTGGPKALSRVLPSLPADFPVPVLIVQHMPTDFTSPLADNLNQKCILPVLHAQHGRILEPGKIYIAPGGRQMKVNHVNHQNIIHITDDPPENSCRPSVDYLFRSVARCFGPAAVGVIMTGMGSDGKAGLQAMKNEGAFSIAQDEASSIVYGMPREVINAGLADIIAPLDKIADEIIKAVMVEYAAGAS